MTHPAISARPCEGQRWPGMALCMVVAVTAWALHGVVEAAFHLAWLDPLVLAILLGTLTGLFSNRTTRFARGVDFGAKLPLEIAVVLIGAAVSAASRAASGVQIVGMVVAVVAVGMIAGLLAGRLCGLPVRLALLIACGNSICGNSAIMAVAPLLRAEREEVASAVAFTATLGLMLVIALPFIATATGLPAARYGELTGLSVYSVPQVVAAAAPLGADAIEFGTVTKLVRVLALVPVMVLLGLLAPVLAGKPEVAVAMTRSPRGRLHAIPWFIVGFAVMMALRSIGAIPASLLAPIAGVAHGLMLIAMAALGLSVDVRVLMRTGPRVIAAASLSLAAILICGLMLVSGRA